MEKIKVLSLFDGISVAQQALKELGIKCEYYASEIDKYAISITQRNFPETIFLGNVVGLSVDFQPDLLIGGSSCQDLSIAKKDREGLKGARSGLFYEYVRILKETKPKYFILENVNSMPKEAKEQISEILGVQPVMINASLVSAQSRKRLFWIGRLNGEKYEQVEMPQPEDRGILLKDILESEDSEKMKSYCIDASYYKGASWQQYKEKCKRQLIRVGTLNSGGQGDRIYSKEGKSVSLSANGGGRGAKTGLYAVNGKKIILGDEPLQVLKEGRTEEGKKSRREIRKQTGKDSTLRTKDHKAYFGREGNKSNCLTTGLGVEGQVVEDFQIRKLTPTETLRLQSMPDDYFDEAEYKGKPISNTQRYKMCGNAFNCEVIKHILSNIDFRKQFMTIQQLNDEAIGAVARGWTYYQNAGKEFDAELAQAIVSEVLPLISKAYEEGKERKQ